MEKFNSEFFFNNIIFTLIILVGCFLQISLKINSSNNIEGTGTDFNNNNFSFNISKKELNESKNSKKTSKSESKSPLISEVTYPNVGFGLSPIPSSQSIHFKNAILINISF